MNPRILFVLVFFLFSRDIPVAACSCAKISSVKANMHTFQTMVETFKVDHGHYPSSVEDLKTKAETGANAYWKEFANPFTSQSGNFKSYMNLPAYLDKESIQHFNIWGLRVYMGEEFPLGGMAGMVLYDYQAPQKYWIYGQNGRSELLKHQKQVLTLSNG